MTALLLTGAPGVGKTTALVDVAERLRAHGREVRGIVTRELREHGRRAGFEVASLTGERATLSHVTIPSELRVGKYGVDLEAFEQVALPELTTDVTQGEAPIYLVDEIGKMECYSERFVAALTRLLAEGRPLAATVAQKGGGFIARVKRREDVELWDVTRDNRDAIPAAIFRRLAG